MSTRLSPGHNLLWASVGAAACLALTGGACGQSGPQAHPSPGVVCVDAGPLCGSGANTSTTPGTDSGSDAVNSDADSQVPVATATVTVSVIRYTDGSFSAAADFLGPAIVGVPGSAGQDEYSIGGDAGTQFTADGVVVGLDWYEVRLAKGTWADLYTTHCLLNLEATDTSIHVPVLDRTVLSALCGAANTPTALDANAAQIVLVFAGGGDRVSGVQLAGSPFTRDATLYDRGKGAGFAVDTGNGLRTGSAGTVILMNVTGGIGSVLYKVGDAATYQSPTISWVLGHATLAMIQVSN